MKILGKIILWGILLIIDIAAFLLCLFMQGYTSAAWFVANILFWTIIILCKGDKFVRIAAVSLAVVCFSLTYFFNDIMVEEGWYETDGYHQEYLETYQDYWIVNYTRDSCGYTLLTWLLVIGAYKIYTGGEYITNKIRNKNV